MAIATGTRFAAPASHAASNELPALNSEVLLFDRSVRVHLSHAAQHALASRNTPLIVELELYFSCLIRKAVRFRHEGDKNACIGDLQNVHKNLKIGFRPVATRHCRIEDVGDKPPLDTMPIRNPSAYVPKWVSLDFRAGEWVGEFGYQANTPAV